MKFAKLPFKKLIQPAIDLAEKGFSITPAEARGLNGSQEAFRQHNTVLRYSLRKAAGRPVIPWCKRTWPIP
jgi:gamma-glutamyltranspeptidase